MKSTQPEQNEDTLIETRLGAWARLRRVRQKTIGEALGVSQAQACRYCLPLGHKNHDYLGRGPARRLKQWTRGAIHAGNYDDPYDPAMDLPPAPSATADPADRVPEDVQ